MATPLCRCRVLYLGCAVPKITKDGLQGIQDPLKDIYPDGGAVDATGIDAWLSVWSNGLLLEYLDSMSATITKFMPVDTLHYCAAVRFVEVNSVNAASPTSEVVAMRFFPLDSPRATPSNRHHPPLFACIMRRTSGIKVLECHGFICKNEIAANALVKACFHAYSDSMNLRLYTDFTPHMIPVIIPKKKSIFKFGKKSRSKSIGPTLIPVHPIPMRSPSPSVNLDPYGYSRVYEWRSPTPRPIFLSTAPTPFQQQHPLLLQQQVQPVPAGDYRYVSSGSSRQHNYNNSSNGIASSLNGDNPHGKQQQRTVWSRNTSSNGGSDRDRDQYLYGSGSPGPRVTNSSRVSSRGADEIYADVKHRPRGRSPTESRVFSPMTTYKPPDVERYYETTTVERRKDSGNSGRRMEQVDNEQVIYQRNGKANTGGLQPPPVPAPYMTELERTLSNGQHLDNHRLSTFKRYESMPELSHAVTMQQQPQPPVGVTVKKPPRDRDLPGMMDGMNIRNGSAGSAERTPASTPASTPALSLSEYFREPRSGRAPSPIIPEVDYHDHQ